MRRLEQRESKGEWKENLPDVNKWQPNTARNETLSAGLLLTCQAAQARIVSEAGIERRFNIHNFDSGSGVEDIVRQEFSKLLPNRYAINAGVVNDRDGNTAGEFDILIRDCMWSPAVKLGATPSSRRFHFAIESIYSAIEVKQTLGFTELDAAMEKLVKLARLTRADNPYGHITENQHIPMFDRAGSILNPLHTTVFATDVQPGIQFQDLAFRFGQINAQLSRRDMVTVLCVLGHGSAWYSVKGGTNMDATFMGDRHDDLQLSVHSNQQDTMNTFYRLYVHLSGHLYRSVLATTNIADGYGRKVSKYWNYPYDGARYNRGTEK